MNIPEDMQYTADHEWLVVPEPGQIKVGITDYAQDALGDVVFVELPATGTTVTAGESVGEVESTKSVSDIFSPVTGTVVAVNEALDDAPETLNTDPYGEGWMFIVQVDADAPTSDTLSADGYRELTEG